MMRLLSSLRSRIALVSLAASALLLGASCRRTPPPSSPAATPSPVGLFRNVAREAGVAFRWGHGGKSPLHILETLGHGCAFLDFDQDGLLDILLVGNRLCALYWNRGNGRFEDVSADSGLTVSGDLWGVAVGDYDNDGYPDVYITGYGKCALYRNAGRGIVRPARPAPVPHTLTPVFVDVTKKAGLAALGPYDTATAAAFADLDDDGKLDLFVGRYIVFTPDSIQFCSYRGIQAGCGVKNYPPSFPRVYRNAAGAFVDATRAWGFDAAHGRCLGVAVRADDRGRGVALYAANDELPGDLFVRQGNRYANIGVPSGTAFNRDGLTQGGMGTDWGDYNNDGRPDLVVATFQSEPSSLYRSDGNDLYTEVGGMLGVGGSTAAYVGWTARFFDYDNDGWSDLFFTNGHTQDNVKKTEPTRSYPLPLQLFHNQQGNLFVEVGEEAGPAFQTPIVGRGAAFGDYDNDGKVDVLVVDEEGAPLLLHNEAPAKSHWLGIRLVGTKCNRDGIGARVKVTAGGRTLVRDQSLAGGYISAHDPRLHFGLGAAAKAEKIVVRWPDGTTDTLASVDADRYIEITQGKGLVRR